MVSYSGPPAGSARDPLPWTTFAAHNAGIAGSFRDGLCHLLAADKLRPGKLALVVVERWKRAVHILRIDHAGRPVFRQSVISGFRAIPWDLRDYRC
jgi:hypothetical protein